MYKSLAIVFGMAGILALIAGFALFGYSLSLEPETISSDEVHYLEARQWVKIPNCQLDLPNLVYITEENSASPYGRVSDIFVPVFIRTGANRQYANFLYMTQDEEIKALVRKAWMGGGLVKEQIDPDDPAFYPILEIVGTTKNWESIPLGTRGAVTRADSTFSGMMIVTDKGEHQFSIIGKVTAGVGVVFFFVMLLCAAKAKENSGKFYEDPTF